MGNGTPKDAEAVRAATRILMDAPRERLEAQQIQVRDMSPAELLQQPTITLAKILDTLNLFLAEMHKRVAEGSAGNRDVKAFVDLVKAHATLRQTQLAEDQFARQTQSLATDADVAMLLVEAVKAGGPQAQAMLRQALQVMEQEPKLLTEGKGE